MSRLVRQGQRAQPSQPLFRRQVRRDWAGLDPDLRHLGHQRAVQVAEVGPIATGEREQVSCGDGPVCGNRVIERSRRLPQHPSIPQFAKQLGQRIIETELALFEQHEHGGGGDRLGRRGQAENGVAAHRRVFAQNSRSQRFDMRLLATVHESDEAGHIPRGHVTLHHPVEPFQARRGEAASHCSAPS